MKKKVFIAALVATVFVASGAVRAAIRLPVLAVIKTPPVPRVLIPGRVGHDSLPPLNHRPLEQRVQVFSLAMTQA